jgi:thiol-disulfide isomerase/thioredoxin
MKEVAPSGVRWRRRFVAAGGAVVLVGAIVFAIAHSNSAGTAGVTKPTAFDLPKLDGPGRVQLVAFRGKPVVVDLFASWCTACQTELPAFAKVATQLRGRVAFVGVDSLDTGDGLGMARHYGLSAAGFVLAHDVGPYPAAGLHNALGAPGMPATAFYDAQGRLVFKAIAAMPEATLRTELDRLYGLAV